MPITTFAQLRSHALATAPIGIAIAGAEDAEVLKSADQARTAGLISNAILVGDSDRINEQLKTLGLALDRFIIRHTNDAGASAHLAVAAVRNGEADILVKGALDSSAYFKAILNKETGLRDGGILSNVTLFELPSYHKLLALTDNAIVLLPTLEQKKALIENTRPLFNALNITQAKVAAVAAIEKENLEMAATTDASWLQKMNAAGQMPGFVVEGPFGYDACICRESAVKKGLASSRVAGDPDLLLMPNLEAANVLGKAFKHHAQADSAGLVLGARVPVVLNSRSDSAQRRLNSLLLAKIIAQTGG